MLDYLYENSSSHLMFIKKRDFVSRVTNLMLKIQKYSSSVSFMLILNFLNLKSDNTAIRNEDQLLVDHYDSEFEIPIKIIEKNLSKFASEDFAEDTKDFVDNQMALVSVILSHLDDEDCLDFKQLKPTFMRFFERYIDNLKQKNTIFDIPLLFSLMQKLDREHTLYKMFGFLSEISDKNTLRLVKDEVKKNFDSDNCRQIFAEVARKYTDKFSESQLDSFLNVSPSKIAQESGFGDEFQNISIQQFSGIEWVMDDESSFSNALHMGLEILRRMMISRNWTSAADFNQMYLNKIVTKNASKIRVLTESEEDLLTKSLIREKEILTKILDVIGITESVLQANVNILICGQ